MTSQAVQGGNQVDRLLFRFMLLSLAAAVVTIVLKVDAAVITGSVGFLSDAMESGVNLVAATAIVWTSVERLLAPAPVLQPGIGLALSTVASLVNLAVGVTLQRVGRAHRSATLVADGKHLMTDVWTSVGVLVGIALVAPSTA